MAKVELRHVRKTFPGGVEAVKCADLVVNDKEFIVLVGPSGCGKSTMLRMVAGLEDVSGGEIHIDGRVVNDVPPKDRDIAMVFQNYALYPHMTVYKNMAFGLILRKYPKKEIRQRVYQAAEILGIQDLLERKPKALSGGQRQRVAVGRAIVRQPKVFLFDEPLSNLDAKLRVQMRAEISKLHTRLQSTMIYVTHDQVEAMTMGDRIVVMLDGQIQQIAGPLTLYNRPANKFVAGFIGTPPMNMLVGAVAAESGQLLFRAANGTVNLEIASRHQPAMEPYIGRNVVMGIRPEDLLENRDQRLEKGASLEARVEVVEPMGSEIYLHMDVGGQPVTARVNSACKAVENSRYLLNVAMEKAHYFDAATEISLT